MLESINMVQVFRRPDCQNGIWPWR